MKSNHLFNSIYLIGFLSLLVGIVTHVLFYPWAWIPYACGALLMAIPRFIGFSLPDDTRLRRLQFIYAIATLLLLASAWTVYRFPLRNYWALLLLLFAAFDLIHRIRYPKNNS